MSRSNHNYNQAASIWLIELNFKQGKGNLINEEDSRLVGVDSEDVGQLHLGEQRETVWSDANLLLQ